MSEEIKPCPFCGSEIEEKDFVEEWIGWWVTCPVCDSLPVPTTKEEAMQQWNQRPYDYDMPAIIKKVQRMEAAINQAITDCIPLLSWVNDDDTAVEMVEHLSEILGGALCKQPE